MSSQFRTGPHHEFFEHLDWYREEDCARLPQELAWSRRECPVVHSGYDGGQYVVTRYDDLRTVGEHPDIFSSSTPGVRHVPVLLPPLDLDPPLHRDFRQFLNPYFSRSFLQRYVPEMRRLADELIDDVVDERRIEFVSQFAIPFTAGSLARVVIDDDNESRMRRAIEAVTAVATGDQGAYERVAGIAAEILAERAAGTSDRAGVLQSLVTARVDGGRLLSSAEQLGVVTVLLLGGLDTTRGTIAHIGRYLAEHPGLEQRLRRPEWVKRDLEELLRHTSTVSVMGRTVTRDNELLGHPLKAGDRLAVHWQSGNRDELKFEHADELRFDRRKNPHIAFGVGIHRCIGQHFARLQIEVAVDRLLRRLTNFSIAPGTTVRETAGVVLLAPAELFLSFEPVPERST
ncbi:cytochrome P450 [Virgisporangium ochraceum]|uniref:Cytochrome P450 n=1 Tax=Virgisporangium ochraceum TaxID=65505 RepID=A0A8J3ZZV6_9ACTN|nr:cytochrome P450 [Virgisporangium ochraceum]GIJ71288.1 cytochrome P450 [Virgisporangium ochraceum]